jgi:hypothetical protein
MPNEIGDEEEDKSLHRQVSGQNRVERAKAGHTDNEGITELDVAA